jgi:hypothetical protein
MYVPKAGMLLCPRAAVGPVSYKFILSSCTKLVATLFGFASVLIGGELILLTIILVLVELQDRT